MKKLPILIFVLIMTVTMAACGTKKGGNAESVPQESAFLTQSETWYHYDEVSGEFEKLTFSKDGTFFWCCECGEPVGNSDCYDLYAYDKNTGIIKLYNTYDDETMELSVINYSECHLLLKIGDVIKGYTYQRNDPEIEDGEKYFSGYSAEGFVMSGNTAEVVLGPCDYDGDVEYPDNAFNTYEFTDDAKAYVLYTYRHIVNGEEAENDVDYREISMEDAVNEMQSGYAYVWLENDLKISKILFYGSLVVEE